jgi:hypothetical protein
MTKQRPNSEKEPQAGKPAKRVKDVAKLASSTEKNKRLPKASGIRDKVKPRAE